MGDRIVHVPLKSRRGQADKLDDSVVVNLTLDKMDIWAYAPGYYRLAMSLTLGTSYRDVQHMVHPREYGFLSPNRKEKKA
jgi:hypothetical protein